MVKYCFLFMKSQNRIYSVNASNEEEMEPKRRKQEQEIKTKTKTKAETQEFPYVPELIVVLILSKLPVQSLFRFRCVSKSWRCLISDPKFNLTSNREQVMVFTSECISVESCSAYLIDTDKALLKKMDLPKQLIEGTSDAIVPRIMGSCNGLVLLSIEDDFFLWNPSTRCCNKVLSYENDPLIITSKVSGLCYDSSLDNYKAVVAVRDPYQLWATISFMVGCFGNRSWTEIPFPYNRQHKLEPGPTVNDHLHWTVTDLCTNVRENSIVCYDAQMNDFTTMSVPQSEGSRGEMILLGLGVLEGCLSMTVCNKNSRGGEFKVLAMKKYGDITSWTSLFVLSNPDGLHFNSPMVPLCRMKKGDVLLQFGNRFFAFCSKGSSYRYIHVPNEHTAGIRAIVLVESLDFPSSTTRKSSKNFSFQG